MPTGNSRLVFCDSTKVGEDQEIEIYYDLRDISVIYLFLEGTLVGEAYCSELMGRRVSIWEAQSENRAQAEQAK